MEDFRLRAKVSQIIQVDGWSSIPSSNAEAERGLSILRKVHADERASLSHSTIVGLISLKFNNVACCFVSFFQCPSLM